MSADISQFLTAHVKSNMDAMLNCAEQQCPHVLSQKDGKLAADVQKACQQKCQISPDFISTLITDQIGLEVHNKVNEINLIIANHISDAVIGKHIIIKLIILFWVFIIAPIQICLANSTPLFFLPRRSNQLCECDK